MQNMIAVCFRLNLFFKTIDLLESLVYEQPTPQVEQNSVLSVGMFLIDLTESLHLKVFTSHERF